MGTSVAETQKHFSFSDEIQQLHGRPAPTRAVYCVVVCDNPSIHAGVKEVTQLSDYVGVELIKLSPYSHMLNPIENVFSVFKSGVKSYLAEHRDAILRPPRGVTKAEHRASYMIRAAKHSMSTKVTSELCDSEAAHTLSFHARALELEDMPLGS
ncbi:hypothetical protein F443_15329 [Phytophthora nicotianae P1569]|uniref:Tc1-like transposase DDE domain-containing protein n=1 Tax=Phytophthora nicotianae P1569 TaxID=1317065 RepID=V9EKL2_PHYNI|nr:hypothetical protein F443_15329 [Phytophthora nicotianae P1569]